MRSYCQSDQHGGSRFESLALTFTRLAKELGHELMSFLDS